MNSVLYSSIITFQNTGKIHADTRNTRNLHKNTQKIDVKCTQISKHIHTIYNSINCTKKPNAKGNASKISLKINLLKFKTLSKSLLTWAIVINMSITEWYADTKKFTILNRNEYFILSYLIKSIKKFQVLRKNKSNKNREQVIRILNQLSRQKK